MCFPAYLLDGHHNFLAIDGIGLGLFGIRLGFRRRSHRSSSAHEQRTRASARRRRPRRLDGKGGGLSDGAEREKRQRRRKGEAHRAMEQRLKKGNKWKTSLPLAHRKLMVVVVRSG